MDSAIPGLCSTSFGQINFLRSVMDFVVCVYTVVMLRIAPGMAAIV
jgi:hypothetical protein